MRSLFVAIGDFLVVPLSYLAAYFIRFGIIRGFQDKFPFAFFIILTFSYLIVFYFFDLYTLAKRYNTASSLWQVTLAVATSAILVSLLKYVFYLFPIGRGILILANSLIILSVFAWRNCCYYFFKYIAKSRSVVILGTGEGAETLGKIIESSHQEFKLIGYLANQERGDSTRKIHHQIQVIGSIVDLPKVIEDHPIDMIILAEPSRLNDQITKNLLYAQLKAIEVVDILEMYQRLKRRIPVGYIQDESWFLKTKGFNSVGNPFIGKIKRFFDFTISAFVLLLSLPLWPFIAFLIKIDSKGPVFYSQNRMGQHESIFSLYKFRSMIQGAEENEPLWAKENDQRITRVGWILRKLHLDELPQLWNVLRGEMSLVGPRPERPEFVEALKNQIPYYSLRHFVKPGLTGWAQINYPYAASMEDSRDKLEYDLYYISHMNLLFDLKILIKTGQIRFFGRQKMK
jgi:sugar transferase (PEP-CTERM system associated)